MEGLCQCGCGRPTAISKQTDTRQGYVKGKPKRFLRGHGGKSSVDYLVEDHGYDTPCWIWQRAVTKQGYGTTTVDHKTRLAHVVYYERVHGPTTPGTDHHHKCDQKTCVNPDHIERRTRIEHIIAHGRSTSNPKPITAEDRIEMTRLFELGVPMTKIAKHFDVSYTRVLTALGRK